jgi:hypothetical protein
MKKWNIALQVYTVRDAAEADFAGTMRKVKEMGYDGVELAGTYGMTVVEMKKILDEIGLELVSAHVGLDLIAQDAILADYAAAGIKFMAIPWFTGPKTAEELESGMKAFARNTVLGSMVAGKILREEQILLEGTEGFSLVSRFLCEEMIGRVITEEIGETNGKTD